MDQYCCCEPNDAHDASLQSNCQCLEERMDGHSCLQHKRLPIGHMYFSLFILMGQFFLLMSVFRSYILKLVILMFMLLDHPWPIIMFFWSCDKRNLVLMIM